MANAPAILKPIPTKPSTNALTNALDAILDNPILLLGAFLAHALLGILLKNFSSSIEVMYFWGVLAVGLFFAFSRAIPAIYTGYIIAYITGVEVLWRMTSSGAYWNGAKFLIIGLTLIAVVSRKFNKKIPMSTLFYVVCLVPAAIFSLNSSDRSRDSLSDFLSVPIALFCLSLFFNDLVINRKNLQNLLLMIAIPSAGIAGIVFFNLETLNVGWGTESNNRVSGFGANQVSSALALGSFALLIIAAYLEKRPILRLITFGIAIFFIAQAFITFSRGGIYNLGIAMFVLVGHNLIRGKNRILTIAFLIAGTLVLLLLFPRLDDTTNNQLGARFGDLDSSGRNQLVIYDIELFFEYPLTGVGLGVSPEERPRMGGHRIAPHTEYTRMLSEHGVLGAFALIALVIAMLQGYLKQRSMLAKSIAAACIVFAAFSMTHTAMRTVMPAFLIGLTFAYFELEDVKRTRSSTAPAKLTESTS
jgi:O-antigen ligase